MLWKNKNSIVLHSGKLCPGPLNTFSHDFKHILPRSKVSLWVFDKAYRIVTNALFENEDHTKLYILFIYYYYYY